MIHIPYRLTSLILFLAALPIYAGTPTPLGSELRINTTVIQEQRHPDIASGANGTFVVVWQDNESGDYDVKGQILSPEGLKIGNEFQVNTYTLDDQYGSSNDTVQIASAVDGSFVIVWQSDQAIGDSSDSSVHGRRFASDGSPIGDQFQVNTLTMYNQNQAAVDMTPDGGFVVIWTTHHLDATEDSNVVARLYSSSGAPIGTETTVNSITSGDQSAANVAVTPDGGFVVVWESSTSAGSDNSGTSIQMRRFASDGSPMAADFQVNSYAYEYQTDPDLAIAGDGSFVVVWDNEESYFDSSGSVQARRFTSNGTPIGDEFQANAYTPDLQDDADVLILDDGSFIIAWETAAPQDGSLGGVVGRRFHSNGVPSSDEFLISTQLLGPQFNPTLLQLNPRTAVFVFDSDPTELGQADIKAQRFQVQQIIGRVFVDANTNGLEDGGETGQSGVTVTLFNIAGSQVAQTTTDADGNYGFSVEPGSYYLEFSLPSGFIFSVQDVGSDDQVDSDVGSDGATIIFDATHQVRDWDAGLVPLSTPTVSGRIWSDLDQDGLQDGSEVGVRFFDVELYSGFSLIASTSTRSGDTYFFDPGPGDYYVRAVLRPGQALSPQDQGGDDNLDSDFDPITAVSPIFNLSFGSPNRSFDAGLINVPPASLGTRVTDEIFRADEPALTTLADGRRLLVFSSDFSFGSDNDQESIQGQFLDDDGSPLGAPFQVNSYVTGRGTYPDVAPRPDGGFVVAWETTPSPGNDANSDSIQARLFDSAGAPLAPQFQVNTYTTGGQESASVEVGPDGSFVVVWKSPDDAVDMSGRSAHGRRFDSAGQPLGDQFLVHSQLGSDQQNPDVAVLQNGELLVAFESSDSLGTEAGTGSNSIQIRRFDSSGVATGPEMQVNTFTPGSQENADIAAAPDGRFVVVWENLEAQGTDSSRIQAQVFDAAGLPFGAEILINEHTLGSQRRPEVGMATDGSFVVVWQSNNYPDDDSIRARRFASDGTPLSGDQIIESLDHFSPRDPALTVDPNGDFLVAWDLADSLYTRAMRQIEIGDRVWNDVNRNGLQDPGEPGLAGIQVELRRASGALVETTATDAEGSYRFSPTLAGEYYLAFQLPDSSAAFTTQAAGDDTADSDVNPNGETSIFNLNLGDRLFDLDAGLLLQSLGDRIWLDADLDSIQDGNEGGFPGVEVQLFDQAGVFQGSTTTGADGSYNFTGIAPGIYYLRFAEPSGFCYTAQDQGGDDSLDSDVDPLTFTTALFTVVAGEVDPSLDAGLVPDASVGNRVWLDNGDGIQDGGEPGLAGVTVHLFDASSALVDSTVTDADGGYGFSPGPGSYYLQVLLPPATAFSPRDQGDDDAMDSDIGPQTGTSSIFTLAPGQVHRDMDAGLLRLTPFFADGFETGDLSGWSASDP